MTIKLRLLTTALLALALGCSNAEQQDDISTEIIVKFASDQSVNETIVKAFDDPKAEASLKDVVNRLSADIGVPLAYSRLTSGREIVVELAAESEVQVEALCDELKKRPDIDYAQPNFRVRHYERTE